MMARIVPDHIVTVESSARQSKRRLSVEEEGALGRVVEKRYWEFAVGRECAHAALSRLGAPDTPILPGKHREPIWPKGYVGSITHCEGYCAVAAARDEQIISIGIDAEPDASLPGEVLDLIAFDEENELVRSQSSGWLGKLIFCAKESVFKAWFPLTRSWLGFEDVRIEIVPEVGAFRARVFRENVSQREVNLDTFHGRYVLDGGRVMTAVVVWR